MKPKLAAAVADLHTTELGLAAAFRRVGEGHVAESDVAIMCETLAEQCESHATRLASVARESDVRIDGREAEPARTPATGDLLGDLRQLFPMVAACEIAWTIVGQGAKATRDTELTDLVAECCEETVGQLRWLKTKIKTAAPQALATG